MKKIITDKQSLIKYNINHCFSKKINSKRVISKEEFNKRKRGKYYKIDDNAYLKLPLFSKKSKKIIALSLVGLLVVGTATTVTVFYVPHKVVLNSNCLEIVNSNKACKAYDYTCSFKIKDDKVVDNYMKNIKISSIKVNGNEIPVEDYSFIYQTNAKNQLTINKSKIGGTIEINADLVEKQSDQHNCFWFEFNIADYANFNDAKISVPNKDQIHIRKEMTQEEFVPLFARGFQLTNPNFNIVDNPLMNPGVNLVLIDKATYTIVIGEETLSFSTPFDMVFVREDNAIKYEIKAKDGKTLPKNLWLRSNARFTKKGEDFFLNFSSDYKSATLEIPYYFVRDNGSLAVNPAVEG